MSLGQSSRVGATFLMPRKADVMISEGDLDGERSSVSESEKRLRS